MSFVNNVNINQNMPDTLVSGAIASVSDTVQIALAGHKSCTLTVSGTWTGTLIVQSSTDNGVTWVNCWLQSIAATSSYAVLQPINSFTGNGAYAIYNTSSVTHYKVSATAFSLGTATIKLTATEAPPAAIFAATNVNQSVLVDNNNSYITNLTAGQIYVGTASSTLGVAGIQVSLKTDQNCTVWVEQSPDGTSGTWDISDEYKYVTRIDNFGITVQAVNSFVRVRVKNLSTATTTYFRLQTCLCPVVEAVPRSLDEHGHFKVAIKCMSDLYTETDSWIGSSHELHASPMTRLIGTSFEGTTKDTNFWTESNTGTGSVTQGSGTVTLATGATANSTSQYQTVRVGRRVGGNENVCRIFARMGDTGTANNIRNWGAFTVTDGFFFQLNGTTLNIVSRLNSSDTPVAQISWNQNNIFTMDTNFHLYEIRLWAFAIYFYIDGVLVHQLIPTTTLFSRTINLPVTFQNNNSGGSTSNVSMIAETGYIIRCGNLQTESIYKNINTATTTICKYGAGRLHSLVINSPTPATITLYDNTSATAPIIGVITVATANDAYSIPYNCPFNTGLTILTNISSGTLDITAIYE